jgi:hypothetical protein
MATIVSGSAVAAAGTKQPIHPTTRFVAQKQAAVGLGWLGAQQRAMV